MALTPADFTAILELHDQGEQMREIAGQLGLPMLEVRRVITENRKAAAPRDQRMAALIEAAAKSGRQRTRTLGERLRVTLEELRARLDEEAAKRVEEERKAAERLQLRDKISLLEGELAQTKTLYAKARAKAPAAA